jgi:hypothetical protein
LTTAAVPDDARPARSRDHFSACSLLQDFTLPRNITMPDPTPATQCTAEFSHAHRTYSTTRPRPAAAAKSRNASPVWCEPASCYSARPCPSRSLAPSPGCRFYDCTWLVCSGFRPARGLPVNSPCCSPARCIVTCSEEAQPPRFRAVALEWWRHTASNVTMSRCQSQSVWKSRSSPRI